MAYSAASWLDRRPPARTGQAWSPAPPRSRVGRGFRVHARVPGTAAVSTMAPSLRSGWVPLAGSLTYPVAPLVRLVLSAGYSRRTEQGLRSPQPAPLRSTAPRRHPELSPLPNRVFQMPSTPIGAPASSSHPVVTQCRHTEGSRIPADCLPYDGLLLAEIGGTLMAD